MNARTTKSIAAVVTTISLFAAVASLADSDRAQAYAAKYPNRIAALLLDGSVDLNRPILDYLEEQSAGFAQAYAAKSVPSALAANTVRTSH